MGCGPDHKSPSSSPQVFLLALVVLSQLCLSLICASSELYNEQQQSLSPGTIAVVRDYYLFSRCSGRFVQIKGRRVAANGHQAKDFAGLRVEAAGKDSIVRIQSNMSKTYLCFNRKGKLKIRHPSGKTKRNKFCMFKELLVDDYTKFQSVADPQWYIGFRPKNGRPLKGYQWVSRDKKCYHFLKINVSPPRHSKPVDWAKLKLDNIRSWLHTS